jgi:hypothetical protein
MRRYVDSQRCMLRKIKERLGEIAKSERERRMCVWGEVGGKKGVRF